MLFLRFCYLLIFPDSIGQADHIEEDPHTLVPQFFHPHIQEALA